MLDELRAEVAFLHSELERHQLACWSMGNLSLRDYHSGLIVIKPSGVCYSDLSPSAMVVVDLDGEIVFGDLRPSRL